MIALQMHHTEVSDMGDVSMGHPELHFVFDQNIGKMVEQAETLKQLFSMSWQIILQK